MHRLRTEETHPALDLVLQDYTITESARERADEEEDKGKGGEEERRTLLGSQDAFVTIACLDEWMSG